MKDTDLSNMLVREAPKAPVTIQPIACTQAYTQTHLHTYTQTYKSMEKQKSYAEKKI